MIALPPEKMPVSFIIDQIRSGPACLTQTKAGREIDHPSIGVFFVYGTIITIILYIRTSCAKLSISALTGHAGGVIIGEKGIGKPSKLRDLGAGRAVEVEIARFLVIDHRVVAVRVEVIGRSRAVFFLLVKNKQGNPICISPFAHDGQVVPRLDPLPLVIGDGGQRGLRQLHSLCLGEKARGQREGQYTSHGQSGQTPERASICFHFFFHSLLPPRPSGRLLGLMRSVYAISSVTYPWEHR